MEDWREEDWNLEDEEGSSREEKETKFKRQRFNKSHYSGVKPSLKDSAHIIQRCPCCLVKFVIRAISGPDLLIRVLLCP